MNGLLTIYATGTSSRKNNPRVPVYQTFERGGGGSGNYRQMNSNKREATQKLYNSIYVLTRDLYINVFVPDITFFFS